MISLRQHAISLAAVFLALAVGVVLGSGVLSNNLLSGLRDESKDLHGQINTLNDQKKALNEKISTADAFDTQMAGRMVHDALNGKSVIVFRTPDANNDDVDAVSRIIGQSGGAVTGTVSLTQEFVDANSAEKLRSVVNSSILPAGAQLSTKLVDEGSQAGDLLGIALLINRDPAVSTVDDTQRDTVLAALRDTGFIGYGNQHIGAANTAVVITGGGLGDDAG
ncbi:MAG TPA: copper transporter, partial [Mycobacterium sp.]